MPSARSDSDSVRHYVSAHFSELQVYVRRIFPPACRPFIDPDDIAQDTAVAALQAPWQIRDDDATRSWLRRIAQNTGISAARHEQRRKRALDVRRELWGHWSARLHESQDPGSRMEKAELLTRTMREVCTLPEQHREVLVLRHLGGLFCREIATLTGLTASRANYQLYLAKRHLRETLKSEHETG
jgi:RNA polymerase sigma factor (sigma-70 family)